MPSLATLDPEIAKVVSRFERARREQMRTLARRLDSPLGDREAAEILSGLTHPLTYYELRAITSPAVAARRLEHAATAALGVARNRE